MSKRTRKINAVPSSVNGTIKLLESMWYLIARSRRDNDNEVDGGEDVVAKSAYLLCKNTSSSSVGRQSTTQDEAIGVTTHGRIKTDSEIHFH